MRMLSTYTVTGIRSIAAFLLLGPLLISCSHEGKISPSDFPEGGIPVSFTAEVMAVQTRATSEGTWTDGDGVAIEIGGQVKSYTVSSDGTLSSANPFMWTNSNETKKVKAWYCGDGSSSANGANASSLPSVWNVQSDQSDDGYQRSDLMVTPLTGISYSDEPKNLSFYHKTARIVVNIRQADDNIVTSGSAIKSVTVKNTALSGTYDDQSGTWTTGGTTGTIGTVIPHKSSSTSAGFAASYEALLIPQNMDGKQFIAVTLTGGKTYHYTPETGEADLKTGKQYIYNITVYADRIKVDVVTGGTWGENGKDEVTSETSYLPSRLKPGDYYYSDGTWSDGGLRGIDDAGKLIVAETKPAPVATKTVVGLIAVVYADKPAAFADAEIKALADKGIETPTAMVVAAKEAGRYSWSDEEYSAYDVPGIENALRGLSSDLKGLANCQALEAIGLEHFPAAQAAMGYTAVIPTETTTGWFLPSAGQWRQIHTGLAGASYNAIGSGDPTSSDTRNWYNYWLTPIPEADRDLLDYSSIYGYNEECWSSTEAYITGNETNINCGAIWQLNRSGLFTREKYNSYLPQLSNYPVRAILVF